jgi:hypothetical protein
VFSVGRPSAGGTCVGSVADARAITDVAFAFREETRVLEVTLA